MGTKAYPEHVAISVWGTAAMRTHGDDIAQIFSLLGIRPMWQQENHRVTGVELIPLSELGRPRIDVTVRISGFFRDAFPHLITLIDDAVNMAIDADEPLDQNFIRKHYLDDLEKEQDESSARFRVFGCPPGAYGIGILDLIEAQNWKDESDFARCYVNWGGYAYSKGSPEGIEAKAEFTHRLTTVEVVIAIEYVVFPIILVVYGYLYCRQSMSEFCLRLYPLGRTFDIGIPSPVHVTSGKVGFVLPVLGFDQIKNADPVRARRAPEDPETS